MSVNDVENETPTSMVERPQYMGSQRSEALEDDKEVVDETPADEVPEENLGAEEESWKKRHGDIRRQAAKEKREFETELKGLKKKMEDGPKWTPPKSKEDIDDFRMQHPDTAEIIESIAHEHTQESLAEVESLKAELEHEKKQHAEDKAFAILTKRHEDWEDIKSDEEFHLWVDDQSSVIQDAVLNNETDGNLSADIIDLYKFQTGITADKEKSRKSKDTKLKKDLSRMVPTKGKSEVTEEKKVWTTNEIGTMSDADYDKYEEEIRVANIEGRVIEG